MEILHNGKSLKRSVTSQNAMFSELVAFGLAYGQEYTLILNSDKKTMHEYLWAEECRVVTLTSLSYNSEAIENSCMSYN
jgi:hypothetical protein